MGAHRCRRFHLETSKTSRPLAALSVSYYTKACLPDMFEHVVGMFAYVHNNMHTCRPER